MSADEPRGTRRRRRCSRAATASSSVVASVTSFAQSSSLKSAASCSVGREGGRPCSPAAPSRTSTTCAGMRVRRRGCARSRACPVTPSPSKGSRRLGAELGEEVVVARVDRDVDVGEDRRDGALDVLVGERAPAPTRPSSSSIAAASSVASQPRPAGVGAASCSVLRGRSRASSRSACSDSLHARSRDGVLRRRRRGARRRRRRAARVPARRQSRRATMRCVVMRSSSALSRFQSQSDRRSRAARAVGRRESAWNRATCRWPPSPGRRAEDGLLDVGARPSCMNVW